MGLFNRSTRISTTATLLEARQKVIDDVQKQVDQQPPTSESERIINMALKMAVAEAAGLGFDAAVHAVQTCGVKL